MEGRDGPPKLIRSFNEILEFVIAKSITRIRGGRARETSGGTSLTIDEVEASGGAANSQRALVTAVHGDYYDCTIDGSAVQVAKPWKLRRNPFNGTTISYTDEQGRTYSITYTYFGADSSTSSLRRSLAVVSTGDPFIETQVVIPRIKTGFDYIDVIESSNGTGVSGVDFIDINSDGRAWCREQ